MVCVCVMLQYNQNQFAEMMLLQLQYKSVKDEMNRLQMQLASIDSRIVPGHHSTAHDRYDSAAASFLYDFHSSADVN